MNKFNLTKPRLSRVFKFAICFVMLSLLVLFGEFFFRVFPSPAIRIQVLDHHKFRSEVMAEYDPILGFRLKKSMSLQGFRHNSHGTIGPEFAVPKPDGVFRILCLGGSTTLGARVESDIYAYPALLQAMFDKTSVSGGKHVEIVNAGVFGYHSLHTAIRISQELDAFRPDVYVIMDGLNDLDAARSLTLDQLSHYDAWQKMHLPDEGVLGASYASACAKLRQSSLFELIYGFSVWSRYERMAGYGMDRIDEKFRLLGYHDNLQKAISHSREMGIIPVLVNDPMRIAPDDMNADAAPAGINSDLAELLRFGRPVVRRENTALAEMNGISLVDPQMSLDEYLDIKMVRRVWADDLHLTRYGYYLVAKAIYHSLMDNKEIRQSLGANSPLPDSVLDSLFSDIVAWRPADGSGRIPSENGLDLTEISLEGVANSNPDKDGWGFYRMDGPGAEAEIVLNLASRPGSFKVFPRIHDLDDSVVIEMLSGDGGRKELFALRKQVDDDLWSPESSWYEVAIPQDGDSADRMVIRLTGKNAQLWYTGKSILFR